MRLGLRARLALTFAGVAAAIVVVYAALVYLLVRAELLDELDRHLHRDYEWASQAIVRGAGATLAWREPQHFHHGETENSDPRVEVWSGTGTRLFMRSPRPLAALRASAEVALRQRNAAAHREALGAVLEETRRLSQLVDGLLLIARADQGALSIERRPCEAGAQGVALRVDDDGPGLAPEAAARVFERFYRADPARARGGFGLGLSIARSLLNVQGGSLEFASRPGAGTTVTLRWAA